MEWLIEDYKRCMDSFWHHLKYGCEMGVEFYDPRYYGHGIHPVYPLEAFDYNDDVSADIVDGIRKRVGVDFGSNEWESIL